MTRISKFFVAALCFCATINKAQAQFNGSGTSGDPYQIKTAADLAQLAKFVNGADTTYRSKHYILTTDIDLSAYNADSNGGKGWIPIGYNINAGTYYFRGVFDGNNKVITGLYINDTIRWSSEGLFGLVMYGGTVKNLGLENVNITGYHSGSVAGNVLSSSNITNCYSTGNISGNYSGGVVGNLEVDCNLSNCYFSGNVSGNGTVGGVASAILFNSSMTNCYSIGNVSSKNGNASGVVGYGEGDCSIMNCYSISNVSGNYNVGGVVGYLEGSGHIVSNCVALNPSVIGNTDVGRVVVNDDGSTYTNLLAWDGILNSAGDTIWNHKGLTQMDGEDITKQAINADGTLGNRFTSTNGWTVAAGKLPGLFGKTVDMPAHLIIINFSGGDGTSQSPYIITTAQQLATLAAVVNAGNISYNNKHYILGNDIDISAYGASFNDGKGWIPIGKRVSASNNQPFRGVFDGNNKKITGLYINDNTLDYAGLFGWIDSAEIKNLGLENVNITARSNVGGVAGYIRLGSSINNCYSTGAVSGGNYSVGGVAGYVDSSSVSNCYSTAAVSKIGNQVGGVVGTVYTGVMRNCYSTGTVSGNYSVGGVAGLVDENSSVSNCYSTGAVSGNNQVGGVAGYVERSNISNCYSTGTVSGNDYVGGVVGMAWLNVSISNCYSTGTVSGNDYVGGVAGQIANNSSISNCAALNPSVKGTTTNIGRVAGYKDATSTLSDNIAWNGILTNANDTIWGNKGATNEDGADISKIAINTDGTLGGRFVSDSGWTTQNYKLPGLFGKTVDMPLHLQVPIPPTITTTSLPNGVMGEVYNQNLTATGTAPITWTQDGGVLPLGLTLFPSGNIAGVPTMNGTFSFTVKATNDNGMNSDTKELSITITKDATGIEELQVTSYELRVYPNPVGNQLIIENGELTIENVEIYDIVGKKQTIIINYQLSIINSIDVSTLASGLYFLKVDNKVIKFVKE